MRLCRLAVLFVAILIVGCARTTGEIPPETTGPAPPTAPAEQPTSPPGPEVDVPPGSLLVYSRAGGFAGLEEEWTIHLDGRVEMPDGTIVAADPAEARSLFQEVLQLEFFAMQDSYVPADTCCDRFFHTITVTMQDKTKTVATMDEAPAQPENLTRLLKHINSLINSSG